MRCFVSIQLPENVKKEILNEIEKLEKSGTCFGKFMNKDSLNISLKFLGELSEEEIEKTKQALREIDFQRFTIETGDLEFLPNEEHVKIIWLKLNSETLEELKKQIDEVLFKYGFNRDEKEFIPHITLAKIKGVKNKELFLEVLKDLKVNKSFFISQSFDLVKSILKNKKPEYKNLEEFSMRIRA